MRIIYPLVILLSMCTTQTYAQNPYCEWDEKWIAGKGIVITNKTISNEVEGCSFRFVLKDPTGIGWIPNVEIYDIYGRKVGTKLGQSGND